MTCKHLLGVWADYDGNVHFEYENTEQLSPGDIFKFCPDCGINLQCEHIFESVHDSYDHCTQTYRAKCIKCGFFHGLIVYL